MSVVGFDTETVPFSPGWMAPPLVCVSAADDDGECVWDKDLARPNVVDMLAHSSLAIANASYDMGVICAQWPELLPIVFKAYDEGRIKDILIRQKLIDLALGKYRQLGPYSLKGLVKRWFGEDLDKEGSPRLDYARLLHVPLENWPKTHRDYAIDDARWHFKVYEAQQKDLEEDGYLAVLDDEDRQTRADFALHLISTWGIRTDAKAVAKLEKSCVDMQYIYRKVLEQYGLIENGKRKVRKAQARMQEVNPKPKLTMKGRQLKKGGTDVWKETRFISVDDEACRESGDEVLESYAEYSQLGSLLNGHVKAMKAGTKLPIHTRFEVLMETGRTSSSGPNIQNVRRAEGTRECFAPRAGRFFVACDYDKAELHTLAQCVIDLFGASKLADALNAGRDPHAEFGERIAKVWDDPTCNFRQMAKAANFGFPGGMGPGGMQRYAKAGYGVELTFDEASALRHQWAEEWPDVAENYLGKVRSFLDNEGYADIEHFQSGRYRTHIPFCTAANSFFQGRAADGAKAALYAVAKESYSDRSSPLYGCRMVNFIHDEILMEAPEDRANEAAWRLRDVMVREFNTFCKDVPVRATPVLMDRWSKKAETIIDPLTGRLEVWRYGKAQGTK